jgi:hypothetical protein
MNLNFQSLGDILPENALTFVGSQILLNLSYLVEEPINLESSCVIPMVKLVRFLSQLTTMVNAERQSQNPSKPPIIFAAEDLVGTPDAPEYELTMRAAIDTTQFSNSLIDPTND